MQTAANSLTNVKKSPTFSMVLASDSVRKMIATTFNNNPKTMERFTSNIMAAFTANPQLRECDPASVISAGLQAVSMNLSLSLSLGQAYLVPRKVKGVSQCVFQLGANGIKALAMRTNEYIRIDFIAVKQGEMKGRDVETGRRLFKFIVDDEEREKQPVVGYLASFELVNGFKQSIYMTRREMLDHAKRYAATGFDEDLFNRYTEFLKTGKGVTKEEADKCMKMPWYGNFESMAEKTILRKLIRNYGPMSYDMETAFTQENRTASEISATDIFDATPAVQEEQPVIKEKAPEEENEAVTAEFFS